VRCRPSSSAVRVRVGDVVVVVVVVVGVDKLRWPR
jgi:hypothetical protein